MSNIVENHFRRQMEGFVIFYLSKDYNISINEAIEMFISSPALMDKINTDDIEDVLTDTYPQIAVEYYKSLQGDN